MLLISRKKISIKKNCYKCGGQVKKKDVERKLILSMLGSTIYYRGRYICQKCGETYYYTDEKFGLSRSKASKRLAKSITGLAVFMPFAEVKKQLFNLLNIKVSATFIEQITVRIGEKLWSDAEKKSNHPYRITNKEKNVETLYVEADGSMVPLIGESGIEYRENKLGIVFNDRDITQKMKKNGKIERKIIRKKVVSSLADGVSNFKKMLFAAAVEKGYYSAKTVVFLSDGASWLAKCKDEYFPKAIRILDWYHAIEHLWNTAYQLFGDQNKEACMSWVNPLKGLLWDGKVGEVISILNTEILSGRVKQQPLIELRGYYVSNQDAMKYDEYRNNGWCIGSGSIESANKYIVSQRLKQSGMKWVKGNANSMIWARGKYFENCWDDFWKSMELSEYLDKKSLPGRKAA